MDSVLQMRVISPAYRMHFGDGTRLDLSSDMCHMQQQLESFEKGSFSKYITLMKQGHTHLLTAVDRIVRRQYRSLMDYVSLENAPLLVKVRALLSHWKYVGDFFKDTRLQA